MNLALRTKLAKIHREVIHKPAIPKDKHLWLSGHGVALHPNSIAVGRKGDNFGVGNAKAFLGASEVDMFSREGQDPSGYVLVNSSLYGMAAKRARAVIDATRHADAYPTGAPLDMAPRLLLVVAYLLK